MCIIGQTDAVLRRAVYVRLSLIITEATDKILIAESLLVKQ